jgi:CheY-like chemotaxis protein
MKPDGAHTPLLVAEDDENDVLLMKISVEKAGLPNPLMIAGDGQEVVDYLQGNPPFNDRVVFPPPGLLVLDLKMPRMNGFEVLAWLAEHPEFKLPVVVLSSSDREEDVRAAFRMGALDYFVKPPSRKQLTELLLDLSARWL